MLHIQARPAASSENIPAAAAAARSLAVSGTVDNRAHITHVLLQSPLYSYMP